CSRSTRERRVWRKVRALRPHWSKSRDTPASHRLSVPSNRRSHEPAQSDQVALASWYFGDDAFMKRSSSLISATRLLAASLSALSNHMYSVLGLCPSATMLPPARYGCSTRTGPLMLRSSIAPNSPTACPSLPRRVAIDCA